tara:strand:- start:3245 stop:4228 length:984 start_codon:yes stop_codon:yes gene_type:complete
MADEDLTTDQVILNSIDEGGDDVTDEQSNTQASTQEQDTSPQDDVSIGEQSGGDKGTREGSEAEQGQDNSQNSRGPQDLVDRGGNVVAAGGKERRFYENAQRFKNEAETLQRQVTNLTAKVEAYEGTANLGTTYSLTPEEVIGGAQLMSAFKQDPVETIKYMLTQAQANGYNIDGVGDGTNVAAISKMINDAVAPLTADKAAADQLVQDEAAARQQHADFMAKYPDAAIHQGAISQLLDRDNSLSPEAAYYKLQNFYLQKGWNWNKSLESYQAEADKPATDSNEDTQSSLPNGSTSADDVTDTAQVASVDTDMDDIIKESMREAGYT